MRFFDRSRIPAWLLAFGLTSIGLAVGLDQLRQRAVVRETARVRAAGEIQRDAAVAHLWLEEYVSGDETAGSEIFPGLERCLARIAVLLGERPVTTATPDLEALTDERLLRQARTLGRRLEELRELSEQRRKGYESGLPVGIGSAIDGTYDAVFADVLAGARELQAALEEGLARRRERSRLVLLAVVAAWGALIAAAAAALWSHERQRRRTAEALAASQSQLLQSQKLDAVGRIAGGLAHDINNYLAAIRGHCELVLMKNPEGRVARKMEAAIRTVLKASALIDRLLAFGHQQPVQLEVVSLNRVIDSLEKMLRPSVGDNVRVEKRLADGLWHAEVDLSQIEQIVVNLMVNARDAMPTGGEIVLETANVRRPAAPSGKGGAEHVMLAVSDTGCGIPREARDMIFEPFWTTKGGGGHSGLGLATVYSIVHGSGGAVEVESEVGRGTTVRIFLPRSAKPESRKAEAGAAGGAQLGGDERILLVDDNEEFRDSTRALLEALGYRVTAAADGEEALALFAREGAEVDLVLTDVVMPGVGGRELVDRLRRERDVKAIFMSGYTEDVVLRHGVEEGEVVFVKKQFSSTSLARLIRELLDG